MGIRQTGISTEWDVRGQSVDSEVGDEHRPGCARYRSNGMTRG
jgi:hypothetical protein